MNKKELEIHLHRFRSGYRQLSDDERVETAKLLIQSANYCIDQLRTQTCESDAAAQRRKAKRKETEIDPKTPVKPVRVAEPSKPKKPKYAGNHAPKTR